MEHSKKHRLLGRLARPLALAALAALGAGSAGAQTADKVAKMSPKELAAMAIDQASHMADLLDVVRSEGAPDARLTQALAKARESAPRPLPGAGPWADALGGVGFELGSPELCRELALACEAAKESQGRCACSSSKPGRFAFVYVLPAAAP